MSIIFQKLSNLKDRSFGHDGLQRPRLQHGKNIYTFKKLVFSPRGALLIFATIAAFGLISFYALSFLKDYLDSGSSKAIAVQHQQTDELPDNDILPPEPEASESPPGKEQATDTEPLSGIEPASSSSRSPKKFKVPEYFIPRTGTDNGTAGPDIPDAPDSIKFLPSLKPNYTPAKKKKIFNHLSPSTAVADNLKSATPQKNISTSNRSKSVSPEKKRTTKQAIARLVKQKRTRKVSATATLAAELEDAFEKNDDIRTDKLLARLAGIKGENSLYYLKLKAFREIKRKNYDLAKRLLNKVLTKEKNDFEAGINMAIIEIRQQKFATARQRLI